MANYYNSKKGTENMKATGIVRRIDDLGRVVIPKEIRRTMRIREGDPLEIFTDRDGEVIFKKYSPIGELADFACSYTETLHKTCSLAVAVTDKDTVIACSGVPKRDYFEKKLTDNFENILNSRVFYEADKSEGGEPVLIVDGGGAVRCAAPIIADGDIIGSVCSIQVNDDAAISETEKKLIKTAADFLGRQFEN